MERKRVLQRGERLQPFGGGQLVTAQVELYERVHAWLGLGFGFGLGGRVSVQVTLIRVRVRG